MVDEVDAWYGCGGINHARLLPLLLLLLLPATDTGICLGYSPISNMILTKTGNNSQDGQE